MRRSRAVRRRCARAPAPARTRSGLRRSGGARGGSGRASAAAATRARPGLSSAAPRCPPERRPRRAGSRAEARACSQGARSGACSSWRSELAAGETMEPKSGIASEAPLVVERDQHVGRGRPVDKERAEEQVEQRAAAVAHSDYGQRAVLVAQHGVRVVERVEHLVGTASDSRSPAHMASPRLRNRTRRAGRGAEGR